MRTMTVLGAASALLFSGCALEEARPNHYGPGDLAPSFGGEVDPEGDADAGSDAASVDGLGGLELGEPILDDQFSSYDAVVLIGRNGTTELLQVSRDGVVTPRALPASLTGSRHLLVDGQEILLATGWSLFTRLLPDGQTLPTQVASYYQAAISAPGEVTQPDEFDNTTKDIETGEVVDTAYSSDTCWMATGDRAGGGLLSADLFSDTVYAFPSGSLVGEPVGESLGWSSYMAEGSDGVVWQGDWGVIQSGFGVDREFWSTDDEIVAMVPLGDTVAVLLETMSSGSDSRLSVFTDEGEQVIASFPNAVLYDAGALAN